MNVRDRGRQGNKMTPERLALLKQCVEDGWSLKEMTTTYGFYAGTVKRYFPNYKGMDLKEAGKLRQSIGAANRKMAKQ